MEHALPRPERPWRKAAFVAGGIAAVELALLLALALPMLTREVADSVRARSSERVLAPLTKKERPAPPKPEAGKLVPRAETSVLVLNGNGVAGAASALGSRVHRLGYIVSGVGNAPRSDYRRTLVMYRPGREGEARRLAKDLGVRVVAPLDGLTAKDLLGAQIAVVLGAA
jgi:hypothetical protein